MSGCCGVFGAAGPTSPAFFAADLIPVEVQVVHDGDLVVVELFEEERFALGWSRSYEQRLREQGWADSPVSKAS